MRSGNLVVLVAGLAGCSTFTSVKPAEVRPGPALTVQGSLSSPVGDEAGWFFSIDCASSCNHAVPGFDVSFANGFRQPDGKTGSIGVGLNGPLPYVDGYMQIGTGARPFGIGGRLGIPVFSWAEHRIYGRVDFPGARPGERYMWNPGLVLVTGSSPNGENSGSVIGIANGFGAQLGTGSVVWTPSIGVVAARAGHESYGQQHGPAWSFFTVAGASVTFQRRK